jgi:hypothetical protein
MTMPTIDARKRHSHRVGGKFAPRPAAYVQHLSDDAFPDSAMQEAARIQRAMSTDMPPMPEQDMPDRTWFDWRDWEWSDLWIVAFVGLVIALGTHIAGLWGA